MTVAGHRVVEKQIQVPGAAYVTLTIDGKNLARQIGGRDWIRIPVQSSSTATARGGSPQSALRLLEQHGIAVRGIGSKTIGGVQCAGYSVTPSRQAMLSAVRQISAGKLPPGVAATLRAVTPPTLTIWLDSHGLLRQMTANLQVGAVPGTSAAAAATVVENFSGYGIPVQILAPARSDVLNYQKFAQHAAPARPDFARAPWQGPGRRCLRPSLLHVEDYVSAGLGAADEHLAGRRGFQRIRSVGDVARQQRRDARVADAGPAAPAGRHVAGLGELQDAAAAGRERRADAAAGEGHHGPGSGGPGGWCGGRRSAR